MSITVANATGNAVMVTALIGIAQRVVQGEWSWTWVAYFWAGILCLTIIGSALAGLYALFDHLRRRKNREP